MKWKGRCSSSLMLGPGTLDAGFVDGKLPATHRASFRAGGRGGEFEAGKRRAKLAVSGPIGPHAFIIPS